MPSPFTIISPAIDPDGLIPERFVGNRAQYDDMTLLALRVMR